jgi:hypothetical protein
MQTRVRGKVGAAKAGGGLQCDRSKDLRGAGEVCVYADLPRIKQPFWDVESVPVSLAPVAEPIREDIGLWRQL